MPTLGELIKGKPTLVVNVGESVLEVVEYMSKNNIGAVPVLDGDNLAGIFSERDLMIRCVSKRMDLSTTKIEHVMTKRVVVMEATDSYEDCLQIMKQESIRHIPVFDEEKQLIGVVSIRDLMQIDVEEKEQKIDILHSYIHFNPKGKP
jgi:CBS domain-containing protein